MSKTIEKRIEAAECEVARCKDEVEDAEGALEDAEAALETLEEERDRPAREADEARIAALVAESAGPQKTIGDRAVRTACAANEIPARYAVAMSDKKLRGLVGFGRTQWASNGHWMVRVESNEGMSYVDMNADDVIGAIGAPAVRDDAPVFNEPFWARAFNGGSIFYMLEYVALVEDLFPGLAWRVRFGELEPIQALVNGTVVAIVMPMRGPS